MTDSTPFGSGFRWTAPRAFANGGVPGLDGPDFDGRIAQLVEQLTLNQRVQGSSPCAPTIDIKDLANNEVYLPAVVSAPCPQMTAVSQ
jgi:hypothetical protein